jgi:putative endopeptidase
MRALIYLALLGLVAAAPGDDFYRYANGPSIDKMTIPPDHAAWGPFEQLRDLSEQRVHEILTAPLSAKPSPADKARLFYQAYMDKAAVEALGLRVLVPDFKNINAAKTPADIAAIMGMAPKTLGAAFFALTIRPDAKDPGHYMIALGQAGLGLPDRDYYRDPALADRLKLYRVFAEYMLEQSGIAEPASGARAILALEQQIADASWEKAAQRDPVVTYNPMSLAALQKAAPGFDWAAYFKAAGLGAPARVIVLEPGAVTAIAALAAHTPLETLKLWLKFHELVNAAPVLNRVFVNMYCQFYQHDLQGQLIQWRREKWADETAEAVLGDAIGQVYAAKYFPPAARAQITALTGELRATFKRRLEKNSWMSFGTRQKVLAKLAALDVQIGYPKKWGDYSKLVIKPDDLFGNMERSAAFEWDVRRSYLRTKPDRDDWRMTPQTVAAEYVPEFNKILLPAAILQPPLFDPGAERAVNYGAIGAIIGGEITHGFDDLGRKYDANGRLTDLWAAGDAKKFTALAQKYGAQFAGLEILPGVHIDPTLTMDENIADLGGLTLAYEAYENSLHGKPSPVLDGLTGEQRFFLAWARVWCAKIRLNALRRDLVTDPRAPAWARVNVPLRNIEGFYGAFHIKEGDKIYVKPEDRIVIW